MHSFEPASFPEIWISKETWPLPSSYKTKSGLFGVRKDVSVGLALIRANMASIRAAERNFLIETEYGRAKSKIVLTYMIRGTYVRDFKGESPFVLFDVFFRQFDRGCGDLPTRLHVYEHLNLSGVPIAEYCSDSESYYWFSGRDTYLKVCNERGEFIGYLVVTEFGYDVQGCMDSNSKVQDDMKHALHYLKSEGERIERAR
jgi:hypothetical protein